MGTVRVQSDPVLKLRQSGKPPISFFLLLKRNLAGISTLFYCRARRLAEIENLSFFLKKKYI